MTRTSSLSLSLLLAASLLGCGDDGSSDLDMALDTPADTQVDMPIDADPDAEIDMEIDMPEEAQLCPLPAVSSDLPLAISNVIARPDGFYGVALGDFATVNDTLYQFESDGTANPIFEAGGSYVIGAGTVNGGLYVPNGSAIELFADSSRSSFDLEGDNVSLVRSAPSFSGCAGGDSVAEPQEDATLFAVLTDFTSTAIAALAPGDSGFTINNAWITSGTESPGLSSLLSGDVTLTNNPHTENAIGIIDRGNGTITRVCPNGDLIAQGSVALLEDGANFYANPQDYARYETSGGDEFLWVSRYDRSTDGSQGNDFVELDASTLATTGRRISLSEYDVSVPGFDTANNANAAVEILARPSGITSVVTSHDATLLVVALERLPADIASPVRGAADGVVLLVDPVAGEIVQEITLEGLANCGRVSFDRSAGTIVVTCQGYSPCGFADADGVRASAAVIGYHLQSDDTLAEEWRVAFN